MLHAMHDLVNLKLGKPVQHPEDLKWLKAVVADMVSNPHPSRFERCVIRVKEKSCPKGVTDLSECKVNPYAVCRSSVKSHG